MKNEQNNKWHMFTINLTLNNGIKTKFISSIDCIDTDKAKVECLNNDWQSGVKSIDKITFENEK